MVTPHLGASTAEAQDKAGLAVARSVKLALAGEFVPDAVNVQAGGVVAEEIRPSLPLTERLGRLFTALAGGVPASLTVEVKGEIAAYDVSVLQLAALRGVFTDVVEEQVTFVNAPLLAAERGIEVSATSPAGQPGLPQRAHRARGVCRAAGRCRSAATSPARGWCRSWSRSTASTSRSPSTSTWCS